MEKPHKSLMAKGFAVLKDEGRGEWSVVAIFDNWIDANNHLFRVVGANRGKVKRIKEIQGKAEE